MAHTCPAIVIRCMDFRLSGPVHGFLVSLGLEDQYDEVSLAGATKGLADAVSGEVDLILRQIELAKKLHGVRKVYIIHHTDCGAYGGRGAFPDDITERAKQEEDMAISEKKIKDVFDELEIYKVLARIGNNNQIDFEMIT